MARGIRISLAAVALMAALPAAAQRVCYLSPVDGHWQVVARNLDGSGRQVLTRTPFDKKDPVFHPDGKRIFFSGVNQGLFQVRIKDGKETPVKVSIAGVHGLRYAADGKRVLFYRARTDVNDQSEIWTGDASLQKNVRLIYRPGLQRYPDGDREFRTIIYLSGRAATGHDLWLYDTQSDKHTQITNDLAAEGAPAMSPSGKLAAFPSAPLGVYNVYVVDVATRASRLLFPYEHTLLDLDWIDDKNLVCVVMKADAEPQLAKISVEGRSLAELPWKEEHGLRNPSVRKP